MSQTELFPAAIGPDLAMLPTLPAPPLVKPVSWELREGDWQDALAGVECDALITDPPYSARTHTAHREGKGYTGSGTPTERQAIHYAHWTPEDVFAFVHAWSARVRGWFIALTDDELSPAWKAALAEAGRYVYSPIACMDPGSRVRLAGDGPSQWSVWAVMARPRTMKGWGTRPGGYVVPDGQRQDRRAFIGGKPLWLMRSLVRHYSRPGDLVCDPCAGAGTTLLASLIEQRNAIGTERDPKTHAIAKRRLSRGYTPAMFPEGP